MLKKHVKIGFLCILIFLTSKVFAYQPIDFEKDFDSRIESIKELKEAKYEQLKRIQETRSYTKGPASLKEQSLEKEVKILDKELNALMKQNEQISKMENNRESKDQKFPSENKIKNELNIRKNYRTLSNRLQEKIKQISTNNSLGGKERRDKINSLRKLDKEYQSLMFDSSLSVSEKEEKLDYFASKIDDNEE